MSDDEPATRAGEVSDDASPVEIDRSPAVVSSALALLAGTVGLAATAFGSAAALAPGTLGIAAVAVGVIRGSRRALLVGSGALFGGVLLAGASGAGPEPLFVGTLGAVLAWDVGENGIGIGEQLGRAAETARAELVHAAAGLLVGAFATVVGYGAYVAAAGGQPIAALVFLLFGVVALVSALRP
ncbi:DUF7519 family protein [Halegenticoccus soli]|uniref:DUF7519 family protein n=1 Tax=Halegenticoccus soli TaxID=1985678 RepID=UPI001E2F319F|nr:hypothetical protein [Halegenticoccus soli]